MGRRAHGESGETGGSQHRSADIAHARNVQHDQRDGDDDDCDIDRARQNGEPRALGAQGDRICSGVELALQPFGDALDRGIEQPADQGGHDEAGRGIPFVAHQGVAMRSRRYRDSEHDPAQRVADACQHRIVDHVDRMARHPTQHGHRQPVQGERYQNGTAQRHRDFDKQLGVDLVIAWVVTFEHRVSP